MKRVQKRQYPPYYLATLAVIGVYWFTIGTYFNDAPKHWFHSSALSFAVSFILFVGGLMIIATVFDRVYPKYESKRLAKNKTKAPLLLQIAAFLFDLILSLVVFVTLVTLTLGHVTSNGFSLSGWKAALPFLLVFLYFFIMDRYLGGTLGKRMLKIR